MAVAIALPRGARHIVITTSTRIGWRWPQLGASLAIDVAHREAREPCSARHGGRVRRRHGDERRSGRFPPDAEDSASRGGSIALLGILPADTGIQWDE